MYDQTITLGLGIDVGIDEVVGFIWGMIDRQDLPKELSCLLLDLFAHLAKSKPIALVRLDRHGVKSHISPSKPQSSQAFRHKRSPRPHARFQWFHPRGFAP